jgi:hypothetical protein
MTSSIRPAPLSSECCGPFGTFGGRHLSSSAAPLANRRAHRARNFGLVEIMDLLLLPPHKGNPVGDKADGARPLGGSPEEDRPAERYSTRGAFWSFRPDQCEPAHGPGKPPCSTRCYKAPSEPLTKPVRYQQAPPRSSTILGGASSQEGRARRMHAGDGDSQVRSFNDD